MSSYIQGSGSWPRPGDPKPECRACRVSDSLLRALREARRPRWCASPRRGPPRCRPTPGPVAAASAPGRRCARWAGHCRTARRPHAPWRSGSLRWSLKPGGRGKRWRAWVRSRAIRKHVGAFATVRRKISGDEPCGAVLAKLGAVGDMARAVERAWTGERIAGMESAPRCPPAHRSVRGLAVSAKVIDRIA